MGPLQNTSHIDSPPWLKNGLQKPNLRTIVELAVAPRNVDRNDQKKRIRSCVAVVCGIRMFPSTTGNTVPISFCSRSPLRDGRVDWSDVAPGYGLPGFVLFGEAKNRQGIHGMRSFYFALREAKGRIQIFYRDYRACLCRLGWFLSCPIAIARPILMLDSA